MTCSLLARLCACAGGSADPSRREALALAFSSTGLLFVRDCMAASPPARKSARRVVVLGAGFAGLACADELAYAGWDVVVIEARDRIGGRVLSRSDLVRGKIVEGGGELVGPNQPTWVAYAKRFGLTFDPMPDAPPDSIELGGKLLAPGAARKLYDEMRTALRALNRPASLIPAYTPWRAKGAVRLDKQSMADWIARQPVSADCKRAMTVQFTAINGVLPDWQSLLGVLATVRGGGLDKFWDETDTCHVKGGCQLLAERLARSLRRRLGADCLQLGTPATAVHLRKEHIEVHLADGRILRADEVVVTLPPSVWSKVRFSPALPPGLTTPMADNVKYLAVTEGRPWQQIKRSPNAMSDGPVQLTWETTAGQGEKGEHALVAITGGREADVCRSWSPEERETRYRQALDRFWPGFAKASVRGKLYDWLTDPHSRGSYSFPAPGQVTVAGPLLLRGIENRLHFAGEHCCYAFTGWMEGALASGVRLAHRLVVRENAGVPRAMDRKE